MGALEHNTMSFVRIGGRTLAYGRGEKAQECAEAAQVDNTASEDAIRKELEALKASNAQLNTEIQALKRDKGSIVAKSDNGLGVEFDFGRRYYQCKIGAPGVGYRNTPSFKDKNADGTGPQAPQYIIADAVCQGPRAVFVRDSRNGLWVPLTDPTGKTVCFSHLGKEGQVAVDPKLQCVGKVKTKAKGAWFDGKNQD